MAAMRLHAAGQSLSLDVLPRPSPQEHQVLIEVLACGVCRTDLHVLDGELPDLHFPVTPGHEIVGRVVAKGRSVANIGLGDRVVGRFTYRATFQGPFMGLPPTGRPVEMHSIDIWRVVDGMAVEHWDQLDGQAFFAQLTGKASDQ
jgi:NADPH:quinone reductase-like Zn-dependent oxidoreductase